MSIYNRIKDPNYMYCHTVSPFLLQCQSIRNTYNSSNLQSCILIELLGQTEWLTLLDPLLSTDLPSK